MTRRRPPAPADEGPLASDEPAFEFPEADLTLPALGAAEPAFELPAAAAEAAHAAHPAGARRGHDTVSRRLIVAFACGILVGLGWLLAARGLAFRRVEKPLAMSSSAWLRSAARSATVTAEDAVQAAALLDDPTPVVASWPVGHEAPWIDRYRGEVVTRFKTQEKVVALTFDDGPDGTTKKYCDLLESYDAKATFFFRGTDIAPGEVAYAVAHGMEIGNHTGSHVGLEGSAEALTRELDAVDDQVFWAVGRRPLWVRARAGSVSDRALGFIEQRGQLYANWNVTGNDANWRIESDAIAGNVWRHVTPGSVVLLHQTRPDTLVALPVILAQLKAKGYRFLTLSEMAAVSEPGNGATPTPASLP